MRPVRRIVTGHDADGRARVASDAAPREVKVGGEFGASFHEVWHTTETPALIDRRSVEPVDSGLVLAPPKGGTRIRVVDFPPEDQHTGLDAAAARQTFEAMNAGASHVSDAPHPLMHRTETIDYGIVLDGEITLVLDDTETVIGTGDIVIQRGTSHAWANRSGRPCRVAFVLIDGQFTEGL